jgi:MYXO-CTERM domain-containing protein
MRTLGTLLLSVGLFLGLALPAFPARAYTTRVHISLANEVREDLIANGDYTLRLRWSEFAVTLPAEDAEAIINQPLAFRAGSIGPDNMIFPGLTDATHAVEQDPYRQCQLLYEDAITEAERAYALGCFLHGSSDAVAHHFVNYFTGETFTLYPVALARISSWSNVVGHITTEGLIQEALLNADASRFSASALSHDIPRSFVLRNYFDEDAPLWQLMSRHARARLDAARSAPGVTLSEAVAAAGLAPYEYLVLAPVFVREADTSRGDLRAYVEGEIADMQDPTSLRGRDLLVGPGADGILGTRDDSTDCDTGCASAYVQYVTYVRLLEPRRDASGRVLPSAFDKIVDELGEDLASLLPVLLQVVENLSTAINGELAPGGTGLDLNPEDVAGYFMPLEIWADDTTTIDWNSVVNAVAPEWLVELDRFFDSLGVPFSLGTLLQAIFAPVLDQVREAVTEYVIGTARTYLTELTTEYRDTYAMWQDDERGALRAAAPEGLSGDTLDYVENSGLWAYSFNMVAATLADHRVVLVDGDPITSGPTSFDASYTPRWTQLGLCPYLGSAVFPEGFDVRALLSVNDGTLHRSSATVDAPVECHDGELTRFGTPSVTSCAHTDLLTLLSTEIGSVSRAFPPDFASGMPGCANLRIPGLPDPPPETDGGVVPGTDGGRADGGGVTPPSTGGCACRAAEGGSSEGALWLLGALGLVLAARRRMRGLMVASMVLLVACGPSSTDPDAPSGSDTGPGVDAPMAELDGGGTDAGRMDAGPDPRRVLMEALGNSVWSARQTRFETSGGGGGTVQRAYEIAFRAASLEWAEIRNPFGPARRRRMRVFTIDRDGETVNSTIMTPDSWPVDPDDGEMESWRFEVIEGSPRQLSIENLDTGSIETFVEGPWAAPTGGLTAEVRVFAADGAMNTAACNNSTSFDRATIFGFARGDTLEMPVEYDVVAGAPIESWGASTAFAVTDIAGFDQLGGTLLSDQANFVVRYTGSVRHPGGSLSMREADDAVDGGLFVFLGSNVGSTSSSNLFLEVQYFSFVPDATPDEPSGSFAAGELPFEAILWHCAGGEATDLEIDLGAGFGPVSTAITAPDLDPTLFPAAL